MRRPVVWMVEWLRRALVLLLVLPLGCGGSDDGPPDVDDDRDAAAVFDVGRDVRDAVLPDVPAVVPDVAEDGWHLEDVLPGAIGASCSGDDDCDLGLLCVDVAGEGICTRTCVAECPVGWSCKTGVDVGGGLLSICLPPGDLLCRPCSADDRCRGGYCLAFDDGQRCTRPCDGARSCPTGYECVRTPSAEDPEAESEQCVPQTGTCDCGPANAGEERPCLRSNENGTCLGVEACDGELGWLACTATPPVPETCNGVDDDCDGIADEDVAAPGDACAVENEHGVCAGAWVCTGTDGWLCNALEPVAEECNFQDDDCDGATDEDFRDAVSGAYASIEHCGVCGNDCRGRFPNATAACDPTTEPATCVVAACAPGYRLVGPLTCVPIVDNVCALCTADAACGGDGDRCVELADGRFCGRDCAEDNAYGEGCPDGFDCLEVSPDVRQCVPSTGACTCRSAEHEGATRPCFQTNAHGTCTGFQTCAAATGWSACDAGQPAPEVCNGQDDDCDGVRDEGVTPPAEPCEQVNAFGTCAGVWSCAAADPAPPDGAESPVDWRCTAPTAAAETCNGRDDDCDGATDEDFRVSPTGAYGDVEHCGICGYSCLGAVPFVAEAACEVGDDNVATCRVVACEPGTFQPEGRDLCVPYGPASHCSPCSADTNCAALPGACVALDGGTFCAANCATDFDCPAEFVCRDVAEGGRQCVPTTGSCACWRREHDGQLRPCFNDNEVGVCTGLQTCDLDSGWSTCTAGDAAPETCNGRDDDCDGLVDEGVSPPAEPCAVENAFGRCDGAWHCAAPDQAGGAPGAETTWRCDAATPTAERCDGADDDCDGATDEDFRDEATGAYATLEHCGACGRSCVDFVPFTAETACRQTAGGGEPGCAVVRCAEGYFQPAGFELCVPLAGASDCTPCADDQRCALMPGACLTLSDGRYCARDCGRQEDCPPGFLCTGGHCVPPSNSCSCLPGAEDVVRTCTRTNEFGVCLGEESCDPLVGWSVCTAGTPAQERCNGVDDDCDGEIDEPGSLDCTPYYRDGDGDTWGVATDLLCLCAPGLGHTALRGGDCDDASRGVNPDSVESCNGIDDDCEGGADEDGADGCLPRFRDDDRDGFGADGAARCLCWPAAPWDAEDAGDCDDDAGAIHPGAPELCNGVDDDCDDIADPVGAEGCLPYFADRDGDEHGDADDGACLCRPDLAHPVSSSDDCDDDDGAAFPGADETCGGGDEDCDGTTDEADATGCALRWRDTDEDGWGVPGDTRCLCAESAPFTALSGGDCDDDDPTWTPLAVEACAADGDCCRPADVCRGDRCMAPPVTGCVTHEDCRDDTFCEAGECLPFGLPPLGAADDDCVELRLPGTLLPEVQCRWAGPGALDPWPTHAQVLGQPVVVDLDLDGDPTTVRPSIVFVAYNGTDLDTSTNPGDGLSASAAKFGVLRVVDGGTCADQAVVGTQKLVGAGSPAAADLDGDGRPELVAHRTDGGVVAFRQDGAGGLEVAWVGHDAEGALVPVGAGVLRWSGPSVTDLDGDGDPEVLVGATVFDAEGALVTDNLGFAAYGRGHAPVAADVDGDGAAELVLGEGVYRLGQSGGETLWLRESYNATRDDGYVALADFNGHGVVGLTGALPEVAVVTTGQVRLQGIDGTTLFGPVALPFAAPVTAAGPGGPPVVADFDADGAPEIGVAGAGAYAVFDTACAGTPAPFGCAANGVLWTAPLRDRGSGSSASTVFDLEDDGLAEVLVADACFLRVLRGTDGAVLFSVGRSSGTFLDRPVVADADGDGRAEVVVVENESPGGETCPATDPVFEGLRCARNSDCPGGPCLLGRCRCEDDGDCGGTGDWLCRPPAPNTPGTDLVCLAAAAPPRHGLTVWRGRDDLWAGTRPVWNQQAYFSTNVTDAGVVPTGGQSAPSWSAAEGNGFHANRQGSVAPTLLPDLTVRAGVAANCDADGVLVLDAEVCNRGAAPTSGPVGVAYYRGDPQAGAVLCSPVTAGPLAPGTCEAVACAYEPGPTPTDVTVVADVSLTHDECREHNSTALFTALTCRNLP